MKASTRLTKSYVTILEIERLLPHSEVQPQVGRFATWLFKKSPYELAEMVTRVFNCSFEAGSAPDNWRTEVVTPVNIVSNPSTMSDFKPKLYL